MIEQLKENYGFLFEEDLITEIGQVGLIKSLKRGEDTYGNRKCY